MPVRATQEENQNAFLFLLAYVETIYTYSACVIKTDYANVCVVTGLHLIKSPDVPITIGSRDALKIKRSI